MKKILVFIVVAMFFAFPALAKEYGVLDGGITVALPDSYTIYRADEQNPNTDKSAEEINTILGDGISQLVAFDTEKECVFIICTPDEYSTRNEFDLKTATADEKKDFAYFSEKKIGEESFVSQMDAIMTSDAEFFKFKTTDYIEYATVIHGYRVLATIASKDKTFTNELEAVGDRIVQSMRFNPELEQYFKAKRESEMLRAHEYYVSNSGITLNIPDSYAVLGEDAYTSTDGLHKEKLDKINKILDEGVYKLAAVHKEKEYVFLISLAVEYTANNDLNLKTATNEEIDEFAAFHAERAGDDHVAYYDAISTPDAEFLKCRHANDIHYTTVVSGHEILMTMISRDGTITDVLEAEGDRLVQSVRFDDTLEKLRNEIEAEEAETKRVRRADFASFVVVLAVLLVLIAVIAWVISGRRRKKGQ